MKQKMRKTKTKAINIFSLLMHFYKEKFMFC